MCAKHLAKNARTHAAAGGHNVPLSALEKFVFAVARAVTEDDQTKAWSTLVTFCPLAASYIEDRVKFSDWTLLDSPFNRHAQLTSNIVEVMNALLAELRKEEGVAFMIFGLQLMARQRSEFANRLQDLIKAGEIFIPSTAELVRTRLSQSKRRNPVLSNMQLGAAVARQWTVTASSRAMFPSVVTETILPDGSSKLWCTCHGGNPADAAAAEEADGNVGCADCISVAEGSDRNGRFFPGTAFQDRIAERCRLDFLYAAYCPVKPERPVSLNAITVNQGHGPPPEKSDRAKKRKEAGQTKKKRVRNRNAQLARMMAVTSGNPGVLDRERFELLHRRQRRLRYVRRHTNRQH